MKLERLLLGGALIGSAAYAARALQIATGTGEDVPEREPSGDMPMLSIVVPARNEARQIERCVQSLLAQEYPHFEVIAVDDESTDDTLRILERIAANDARLRVVRGAALPAGWVGKPWGLQQGSDVAGGEWLLFTDADTEHAPRAAASAVGFAIDRRLDVLSLLVTQVLETIAERMLLPTILWTIVMAVGPLDHMNDPDRTDSALFNGQFILARAASYRAFGGHAVVAGEIAEDYELARRLKSDGRFRTVIAGGSTLVRTRMYRNAREIWNGFTKNMYLGARHHAFEAPFGLAMLASVSPLPEILALRALMRKRYGAAAAMLAAIALTAGVTEFGMRRSRFPTGSGLWLPVGMAATVAIALNSARRFIGGSGVEWRGRRYGEKV